MASPCFLLTASASATSCSPCTASTNKRRPRLVSCKAKPSNKSSTGAGDGEEDMQPRRRWRLERRELVLLGGLTGAAAGANLGLMPALAADDAEPATCITAPITDKLIKCVSSSDGFQCPVAYLPEDVIDFTSLPGPPPTGGPLRVRRPAHLLDAAYAKKYEAGVRMMKALPDDDPRSFKSQAAIHEAYCNFHYKFASSSSSAPADFDVHFSSVFAPWHRMYIYFYERIIGELTGDPAFALPYWNWDSPDGMSLPAIFADAGSPLYDAKRNQENVRSTIDLNLGPGKQNDLPLCSSTEDGDDSCVKAANLCTVYRQMAVDTAAQFHGDRFCAARVKAPGSLENAAHTAVHIWTGDPMSANAGEDMGVLGTAARDPVFYSHHANVDRLWHLWRSADPGRHADFVGDEDWLRTSFVFFDENRRPVRIRVRDVLEPGKLGYAYEARERLEWLDRRPKPAAGIDRPTVKPSGGGVSFPLALKSGNKEYLTVKRPEKNGGSKKRPEKNGGSKKTPEVLVVDVSIDPCEYAKFDVLVNVPRGQEGKVSPQNSEFAGSFVNLPHGGGDGGMRVGMGRLALAYRFALRELIEDLRCGGDATLDVTLVPVAGETVVVDGVRVELLK